MEERSESWVDRLWKAFSSMKMGLVLLGLVALVAGIGTLIPQAEQDPQKAQTVAQIWQTLGFTHLYSTVWFRLVLGLLCVNLIVCSIQRFSSIYRQTFKLTPPVNLAVLSKKINKVVKGDPAKLKDSVQEFFNHKHYRVIVAENEKQWSFIAAKRRLGHWGSFITHLSFVVLVIGALLGSMFGFKGYLMEPAGSTTSIQGIQISKGAITDTFDVKINSAEDRYLPNGERDNWYTDLSILQNGKEMARKTISVNHPFQYQGVTFYQSSFANGAKMTAEMSGQKIPFVLQEQGQNYFQAPGTDLYLIATTIMPSVSATQKGGMLYQVYKGTGSDPVQSGQLAIGQTVDIQGSYKLTMNSLAGFTGLQIKKDPGVVVIWLGCFLLVAGLLLAFYYKPQVFSGVLQAEKSGEGTLTIGASSAKGADTTQKILEELVGSFKH